MPLPKCTRCKKAGNNTDADYYVEGTIKQANGRRRFYRAYLCSDHEVEIVERQDFDERSVISIQSPLAGGGDPPELPDMSYMYQGEPVQDIHTLASDVIEVVGKNAVFIGTNPIEIIRQIQADGYFIKELPIKDFAFIVQLILKWEGFDPDELPDEPEDDIAEALLKSLIRKGIFKSNGKDKEDGSK